GAQCVFFAEKKKNSRKDVVLIRGAHKEKNVPRRYQEKGGLSRHPSPTDLEFQPAVPSPQSGDQASKRRIVARLPSSSFPRRVLRRQVPDLQLPYLYRPNCCRLSPCQKVMYMLLAESEDLSTPAIPTAN